MVKKSFSIILLLLSLQASQAQETGRLTLSAALDSAVANYPLTRQKQLIDKNTELAIQNLQKSFLPQVSVLGQASWQSDVTAVSVPLPNFSITPPSKDQYKLVTDISQLLYDGGMNRSQRELQSQGRAIDQQKIEVELYRVREKVQQAFLSVLYVDEQVNQVNLLQKDIDNGLKKVEAQLEQGVVFRSAVDLLKAEWLKAEQRKVELLSARKGLIDVLSVFLNRPLAADQLLETPAEPQWETESINRPEWSLLDAQQKLLFTQSQMIDNRNKPKASLFAQAGYGRPGLNMLKNEFAFFYIGGLRLNWSLSNFYTHKKEKQILGINQSMIELQKESFLLQTKAQLKQQSAEILKIKQLLQSDQEIITLRERIKEAAKAQLDNQVITANDYLREVNAADLARQNWITHQLQLLQAELNYKTISGK